MHTNLLSAQQIYAGDSEKMEHLIFPSSGLTMAMLKKNPFIIYRALKATVCLTSERVKLQTFLKHPESFCHQDSNFIFTWSHYLQF